MSGGVMGFDPGTKGGVAVLRLDGAVVFVAAFKPSMTHGEAVEVAEAAKDALRREGGGLCFAEKVGVRPRDGKKGANTFGRVDGLVRGAILARPRVVITDVPPMTWQGAMDCLTGGDKNVSKARAQQVFPDLRITHAIGDALLIAEYGRRWLAARPHLAL